MANARLTTEEINKQLLGEDTPEKIRLSEEKRLQIIKSARKKFRDDEEKAQEASNRRIAKLEQKLNAANYDERIKQLKEEAKLSLSNVEKISKLTKATTMSVAKEVTQSLNSGIEQYLGVYSQYMSGIETRLQGSAKTFKSITGTISSAVGSSQYVSQRQVLQNLSELVKQGINYNVEQRAFLATISDRIATTFDAFDSNLARIIRIQQADSTAARLGLESQLTKFFNQTFGDTSYLSQMFDTVSATLLSASATMGREKSVAFEYTVQKWLGSLGAVGVSESTIQQLAQGISYLGTGDVTGLAGNQALQNLLVMASSRAGLDYGSMLTGGITSSSVNALLKSVVQLSQEVANTNNRVVLSQYAKIFGMDITDLVALSNLTAKDLVTISSNMLQYEQLYAETESQIRTIGSRMTLKDRIDTMFDNIMSSVGENIANSAIGYTTWLITDLVEKATGGISTIEAAPFGIGVSNTVTQLIKTGIVGLSTIAEIPAILAGLTGANQLSLANWGAEDVRTRGTGFTGLVTTGVSSGVSESRFIGSSDESAIYEGSIVAAKEEARTVEGQKPEEEQIDYILKHRIADNIDTIIDILDTRGVVVRSTLITSSSAPGVPSAGLGG